MVAHVHLTIGNEHDFRVLADTQNRGAMHQRPILATGHSIIIRCPAASRQNALNLDSVILRARIASRVPGYFLVASTAALRCAMAAIEIMGLTPEALGKDEPSITYKFFTSQVSPSGFVAENPGESPIRAVPIMWKENNATCAFPQPAASMSFTNVSMDPFFSGS